MYSLRQMALDDKISEQVSIGVLTKVYPTEIVQQCLEQSASEEQSKARRLRYFVPIGVVWFVLAMALWTRLAQARVWDKLTHKLHLLHPNEHLEVPGASALSYQRGLRGHELFSLVASPAARAQCGRVRLLQ